MMWTRNLSDRIAEERKHILQALVQVRDSGKVSPSGRSKELQLSYCGTSQEVIA